MTHEYYLRRRERGWRWFCRTRAVCCLCFLLVRRGLLLEGRELTKSWREGNQPVFVSILNWTYKKGIITNLGPPPPPWCVAREPLPSARGKTGGSTPSVATHPLLGGSTPCPAKKRCFTFNPFPSPTLEGPCWRPAVLLQSVEPKSGYWPSPRLLLFFTICKKIYSDQF